MQLVDDSAALYYIQKGGSLMKQGFSWLGGMMATGVNKSGQYIQSKINSNPKEKKVSDSTKSTFEQIKANTNQSIKVAGGIITQLVTPIAKFGNQVIEDVSKKIDNSNSDTLKSLKQVTKTTSNAMSEAFSGLSKGVKDVGNAMSTNTRGIVEKKYGQDVSNTFLGPKDISQNYIKNPQSQEGAQSQENKPLLQQQNQTNQYPDLSNPYIKLTDEQIQDPNQQPKQ